MYVHGRKNREKLTVSSLSSGDGYLDSNILPVRLYFPHILLLSLISAFQVRFADRFVDPAMGFAAGYNFFALQAALVPFEVVAFNLVLQYWTDKIPLAAVICFVLLSYACVQKAFSGSAG